MPLLTRPRSPWRRGAGEARAPQARRAHQDHAHVGHRAQQLLDRAVASQILQALAIESPGRVEQQRVAGAQGAGAGLDDGLHLIAGAAAVPRHVGHLQGPHPAHQEPDARPIHLGPVGQDARPEARPQHAHQDDRVDERGVVGQEEHPALARRRDAVQPANGDPVAQPQEAAHREDKQPVEHEAPSLLENSWADCSVDRHVHSSQACREHGACQAPGGRVIPTSVPIYGPKGPASPSDRRRRRCGRVGRWSSISAAVTK